MKGQITKLFFDPTDASYFMLYNSFFQLRKIYGELFFSMLSI